MSNNNKKNVNQNRYPCLYAQLIDINKIYANDYNPNFMDKTTLNLLIKSIKADGFTQPIVVAHTNDIDSYVIIDGYHRFEAAKKLKYEYIPVVVLEKTKVERVYATIRHNRAKGVHTPDGMSDVIKLLRNDEKELESDIASQLSMSINELSRYIYDSSIEDVIKHEKFTLSWDEYIKSEEIEK